MIEAEQELAALRARLRMLSKRWEQEAEEWLAISLRPADSARVRSAMFDGLRRELNAVLDDTEHKP